MRAIRRFRPRTDAPVPVVSRVAAAVVPAVAIPVLLATAASAAPAAPPDSAAVTVAVTALARVPAASTSASYVAAPALAAALPKLHAAAPALDREVLALALQAGDCARQRGLAPRADKLAVIDYSRPSTEPRLWVFDLAAGRLLFSEHVAHGRGSGERMATAFSNLEGSHQTSLGVFTTGETYVGGNGYSLRMDGLEPGFNDRARDRAIVIHGAWYAQPDVARRLGRLGRSYGCPAVRPEVARPLIDTLKGGQLVVAYYPDRDWLARSRLLSCRNGFAGNAAGPTPETATIRQDG